MEPLANPTIKFGDRVREDTTWRQRANQVRSGTVIGISSFGLDVRWDAPSYIEAGVPPSFVERVNAVDALAELARDA